MRRVSLMLGLSVLVCALLNAQVGTAVPGGASTASVSTNKMDFRTVRFVCGGKAQAGTPITALGAANSSGTITISGIPVTAIVDRADLFWSVLTDDDPATSTLGQNISLNGQPVVGFKIGHAFESPCFTQDNTISYRADVTGLISSPGNGIYTVSGLPVAPHFSEGVTLQILWADANGPLMEDNLYHAIGAGPVAVTQADLFSQDLTISGTNATGPVSAKLYEVIGNGQSNGLEDLRFDGPCAGEIGLDDTLDGSTVAKAAETCTDSPVGAPECFWDDDVHDVSAQFACAAGNAATSASLVSPDVPRLNDCFDWPALSLLTSTDEAVVCAAGGTYVDHQCPAAAPWRNHGQYLSCVSEAAQRFLAGLPYGGSCPRAEIQSCIVNPRAKSDVGKR